MASSFIYRVHIETLDNIFTPDILIDRLLVAQIGDPEPLPIPIDRITTDNEIQVVGSGSVAEASLALIGSGAGMLISIASNHRFPDETDHRLSFVKPLCRQAWRYNEVANHVSALVLRTAVISSKSIEIVRQDPIGNFVTSDIVEASAGTAILYNGLTPTGQFSTNQFQIELEDPILERILRFRYRVQVLCS